MPIKSAMLALALLAGCFSSSPLIAATPKQAADQLETFLAGLPDLGPGYAVVVVTADQVVLQHTQGLRNSDSSAALTADTPIYIASQTKAYMGLLAQQLDQRGVLPLNTALTKFWPDLKLPGGLNPADWTLADLLNHRLPIEVDEITQLEAYFTELDYRDYPSLIERFAKARAPGFRYDNLGYNLYAAILHQATGKSWREWLRDEVFKPLALTHTSTRTSDFPLTSLAYSHVWLGDEQGWLALPPKTDPLMQSAGGMVTSPTDMGRWLQWHLGDDSANAALGDALREAAHRSGVEVDPKARNAYELPCSGYAYGWNVCDFNGHTLYIHGGGYTGARTMMAFSPDLAVGIGVFSNSDNMTGWLTSRTVVQYLQFLTDHPEAEKWAALRQKIYPERIEAYLDGQGKALTAARGEARWNGWTWNPKADQLKTYAGQYRAERLPLSARITLNQGALQLQVEELSRRLAPASADLFGATSLPLDPPEPLQFERNDDGAIVGFRYQDERFVRLP